MSGERRGMAIGRWRGARQLVVALQNQVFDSDEDSRALAAAVTEAVATAGGAIDRVGLLVFTDGAGPTARQRADIRALLDGRSMRAAVVTASRLSVAVVAAIRWFNPDSRAFAPADVAAAFRYLEVAPGEGASLWAEIDRLDAGMDLTVLVEARASRG